MDVCYLHPYYFCGLYEPCHALTFHQTLLYFILSVLVDCHTSKSLCCKKWESAARSLVGKLHEGRPKPETCLDL